MLSEPTTVVSVKFCKKGIGRRVKGRAK